MAYENEPMRAFSWDETITLVDPDEFDVLPEGDYDFTVKKIERSIYQGKSDKLPPSCPTLVVSLEVTDGINDGYVTDNLYMYNKNIRRISGFFAALGLGFGGQNFSMGLINDAIGRKGRCKIKQTKSKTTDAVFNNVSRYYSSEESKKQTADFKEVTAVQPPAQFTQPQQAPAQPNMWANWGATK